MGSECRKGRARIPVSTRASRVALWRKASVLQQWDVRLAGAGRTASQWYAELPVPDPWQLRELYLTAVEAVNPGLREKYAKIYRNY